MNNRRCLSYAGSEFLAILSHEEAVQFVGDSGYAVPQVPPGLNTISMYFPTRDNLQALVINQVGFDEVKSDQGLELNGGSVYICLDRRWDKQRARYLLKALKNYLLE
jgi:hypothetical protein